MDDVGCRPGDSGLKIETWITYILPQCELV